jgi:hypothetical protein
MWIEFKRDCSSELPLEQWHLVHSAHGAIQIVEKKPMPSSHYQTGFDKKGFSGRLSFAPNAVILRRRAD